MSESVKEITDKLSINIDPELFKKLGVKRGLRNEDGTGVLAGLTNISTVIGYEREGDKIIPIDGRLEIRGCQLEDIIEKGFEYVIYLLLSGTAPSEQELTQFKQDIRDEMILNPKTILNIIELEGDNIMNVLARSVLELYVFDDNADSLDKENLIRQSVSLISKIPLIIAYAYNIYRYKKESRTYHMRIPKKGVSLAENFLWMIKGHGYTKDEVDIFDKILSLHCEHGGGNNSTFSVRVTSSTGTDIYSSIAAGIGSLKGPKHGGANIMAKKMIDDIKKNVVWDDEESITSYIDKILNKEVGDRSGLLYGIGHAVYTLSDPRAEILKICAEKLAITKAKEKEYQFMCLLEKCAKKRVFEKKGKTVCTNVDFWSGFVYDMLGIPEVLYTPLFAMARVVGWCAHRNEELLFDGARIIRPAYKYTFNK